MDHKERRGWHLKHSYNSSHDNETYHDRRFYGHPAPHFEDPRNASKFDSSENLKHVDDNSTEFSKSIPCRKKLRCALVAAIVLAVLGLVGGIAAAAYFTSQQSKEDELSPTKSKVDEIPPTTPKPLPVEFNISLRLPNQNWDPELVNATSRTYKVYKLELENQIDTYFMNSSLASSYIGTEVNGFSQGSVLAALKVAFKPKSEIGRGDEDEIEITIDLVLTILKDQVEKTEISRTVQFIIDAESIQVELVTPTSVPTTTAALPDLDACIDANCSPNAVCTSTAGVFSCSCKTGYTGDGNTCQNVNECTNGQAVCSAKANCLDTNGSYLCSCKHGYTGNGKTCFDIDDCATLRCVNGQCNDMIGHYVCECDYGFEGKHCETNIVDCASNHCDQGNCIDEVGNYTCECYEGWTGYYCDRDSGSDKSGSKDGKSGDDRSLSCDFEDDYLCGYIYANSEWTWQESGPQSLLYDDGHFMVSRSNSTTTTLKARLQSPVQDIDHDGCIFFKYSTAGDLAAALKVFVSQDGEESLRFYDSGAKKQLDEWYTGFFSFKASLFHIIFEAGTSAYQKNFPGTIVIDEIIISEVDCPELNCDPHPKSCGEYPVCFPRHLYCNGVDDCSDGSDEQNCGDPDYSTRLVGGYSSMGHVEISLGGIYYAVCSDDWKMSNAQILCGQLGFTGSDALIYYYSWFGLPANPLSSSKGLSCDGHENNLKDCSVYNIHDGHCSSFGIASMACKIDNCYSWEDECPSTSSNEVVKCIKKEYFCDGNPDCPEGTDEEDCEPFCDKETEFHCGSHQCISRDLMCDGIGDCSDKSDEHDCILIEDNSPVQVKFYDHWMSVCADSVDRELADLLCHKAGYGDYAEYTVSSSVSQNVVKLNKTDKSSGLLGYYEIKETRSCSALMLSCSGVECGLPSVSSHTYVLHGRDAVLGEWPWQCSLEFYDTLYHSYISRCGCSLIDQQWVLTAAHCIAGHYGEEPADYFKVSFGYTDQTSGVYQPHKETYHVKRIYTHCTYGYGKARYSNYDGDIALLHLASHVEVNEYIHPVCLASQLRYDLDFCYITGWGSNVDANSQNYLLESRVSLLEYDKCNKTFLENGWAGNRNVSLPRSSLCIENQNPGSPACHGDSGGPAVCKREDGRWEQVGLTSWGDGMCSTDAPAVYQSVGYYRKWIDSIRANGTWNGLECSNR